ncbi:dCTP deaminase domain-containing protein [Burkholderia gladioli]|uniref:dCTP deaminase domain-containing protein n=1 Tax=Burkholderia gladioli TaxID=28095 RepID=UPI0016401F41
MIIPPRTLFVGQAEGWPVQNLAEREIVDPEGVGVDLQLDAVHEISGRGALRCDTRKTADSTPLEPDVDGNFLLVADRWYLVKTVETMKLPLNLAGTVFPRSTLFRSGVALHSSVVPPGYEGPLIFGLNVVARDGFLIQRYARFCHLVLSSVDEGATNYRGQWQHGRVVQPRSEPQK